MSDNKITVEMTFGELGHGYVCDVCGGRAYQYWDPKVDRYEAQYRDEDFSECCSPPVVCASNDGLYICKACLENGHREEQLEARIKERRDRYDERVEAYAKDLRDEIAKLEALRGRIVAPPSSDWDEALEVAKRVQRDGEYWALWQQFHDDEKCDRAGLTREQIAEIY